MKKKKTNLIPLEERTLSLVFESKEDIEQWLAWYLDGGGEEDSQYYTNHDTSKWLQKKNKTICLEGDHNRCPECKSTHYLDIADTNEYNQNRIQYLLDHSKKLKKTVRKQFICEDCHCNYDVEEEE